MNNDLNYLGNFKIKDLIRVCGGVFICLFSVFGALNYGIVSNFITWCISFLVGGIFSYVFYVIFFLFGLSLIFHWNKNKISFNFVILGLIFMALGVIIIITNSMFLTESSYLTFNDGNFYENFLQGISISENFPLVDFSQNCGLIGLILVAIINTGMTYIGSNVIGSALICLGFIFTFLKIFVRFFNLIKSYNKNLKEKTDGQIIDINEYKNVSNDDPVFESVPENEIFHKTNINLNDNNAFSATRTEINDKAEQKPFISSNNTNSNNSFYNEKPIYSPNQSIDGGLKKAIYDSALFKNNNQVVQETNLNKVQNNYSSDSRSINNSINNSYYKEETNNNRATKNEIFTSSNLVKESNSNLYHQETYNDEPLKNRNFNSELANKTDENNIIQEAKSFNNSNTFFVKQEENPVQQNINTGRSINFYDMNSGVVRGEDYVSQNKNTLSSTLKKENIDDRNNDIVSKVTNYDYPPSSLLLERQNAKNDDLNRRIANERSEIINKLCRDFNFGAHVVSFTIGPSVTRYDLKVDENTQVSRFNNYVEDLGVRLSGVKVRFERIVPGKNTSGIEIQNEKGSIVDFKDVFEHLPTLDRKKYNGLLIPFGKDISGNYITADLREFPHLLIAGTTGSGKSVFMQTMIMTMIMRNSPEDLRLFIIDPKRVEFTKYKDIPHLLGPICTEAIEAYNGLLKIVEIMENRYRLFEDSETTDIKEYNRDYAPAHRLKKLPYIVVVIDEYSNLVEGYKKVSEPVLSIAQKARACGIHLIIATQAPRTSIITGVIKANLPTRVALLCGNSTDSQNVIDVGGAERLLGNGDMLIKSPLISTTGCARVQGAFVEAREIKNVVEYIKSRYDSDYVKEFVDLKDELKEETKLDPNDLQARRDSFNDELYEKVKNLAMSMEYFSISKITRIFNVGFNRAGKIFIQLQKDGIIDDNPQNNDSRGTKVLIHSKPYSTGETVLSGEDTKLDRYVNPDED